MGNDKIENKAVKPATDMKTRIIAIIVLALALVTVWFMLDLVLMTFILSFVFYQLLKVTEKGLDKTPIGSKRIPDSVILIVEYILGLGLLSLMIIAFTTIIVEQTTDIARAFFKFDYSSFLAQLDPRIAGFLRDANIPQYLETIGTRLLKVVTDTGSVSFNFLLSVALSFLILLEKEKLRKFGKVLSKSRLSFLYDYFMVFGHNFSVSFGKVMKVQVTIAFINSILSIILLAILGFPNIWGLGVMIFALGLIPVAGVIISLIPLAIIAFNIGGIVKLIEILIMVLLLHIIEAYVLNPKLMSSRTSLPICLVFIILLVAQKYLGVWGLLIGVPLFIFVMNIFGVDYEEACTTERSRLGRRIDKLRERRRSAAEAKSHDN